MLVSTIEDEDLSDLSAPTKPSRIVASGFDELPPSLYVDFPSLPPNARLPDPEAATVRRPVIEQRRPRKKKMAEPQPYLLQRAALSGVAGLAVGLLVLVPITLAVIWGQY